MRPKFASSVPTCCKRLAACRSSGCRCGWSCSAGRRVVLSARSVVARVLVHRPGRIEQEHDVRSQRLRVRGRWRSRDQAGERKAGASRLKSDHAATSRQAAAEPDRRQADVNPAGCVVPPSASIVRIGGARSRRRTAGRARWSVPVDREAVDVVGAAAHLEQAGRRRAVRVAGRLDGRQVGGGPLLDVAAHVEQLEAGRGRDARDVRAGGDPSPASAPGWHVVVAVAGGRRSTSSPYGKVVPFSPRRRPATRPPCRAASRGPAARRPPRPRPS